jgi:uncharacterized phiE125 gp8 family phage protein
MTYLIKTAQPVTEPITLAEAQLHLRLDVYGSPPAHPDDSLVLALITAARESAEMYTGLTIGVTGYQAKGDIKNDTLSLQTFPVNSVSLVTYVDSDGVTQTVDPADYSIDSFERSAVLRFSKDVPATEVTVTFTAGFTDGESPNPYPLPKPIYVAMLLMIGNLYENRESVSDKESYERPQSAISLMTPYRINMGM